MVIAQAAALEVIEVLERDRIPERAARMGALFTRGLQALQVEYPQIGDVRGPGLVILATAAALPQVLKIKPPLILDEGEIDTVLSVLADC